jgi:hypothetical protein
MRGFGSDGRCMPETGTVMARRTVVAVLTMLVLLLGVTASAYATEEMPKNKVLPSIGGTPLQQYTTLNAKKGEWTGGGLTYSYQWQRCETECTNIAGGVAKVSTYSLQYADIGTHVRVIVTAKNNKGSAEADSAQYPSTGTVAPAQPKNISAPVVSGVYQENQLLSVASVGGWSGTPANSYRYQWERCNTEGKSCKSIEGATEASYRTTEADYAHKLRVTVTAVVTVAGYELENSGSSGPTPVIEHGPPVTQDGPSISGALRVGGTLKAASGHWVGQPPITYTNAWERCNAEGSCSVVGESSTYTVAAGDVGKSLRLAVTASNELGSATAKSVSTPIVLGFGEQEDFAVSWGEGFRGQLGTDYRTMWEDNPVPIEGVSDIASIAMGGTGSYELHSDGTISASGAGWVGTIGDGGRKASWEQGVTHVTVKGITTATQVSGGNSSAAALLANGHVVNWGSNGTATFGNGKGGFEYETGENQLEPKEVEGLEAVTSIVAHYSDRFALLPGGRVDAWGYNRWGQLGIEWTEECEKLSTCETEYGTNKSVPKKLIPGEPAHKCFRETGWEFCYKRPAPVLYEGEPLEGVTQIAAGAESTYALLEGGEVLSWGNDNKGQLGQTVTPAPHTDFTPPGKVMLGPGEPLHGVVAISAGHSFGLALVEGEGGKLALYGWGYDEKDQMGPAVDTCTSKALPCDRWARPLGGPEGVEIAQVAAGAEFTVLLGTNGRVYTIGSNALGQLGRGAGCELGTGHMGLYESCYSGAWGAVPGLENVRSVDAGPVTVLALVEPGGAQPLPVVGSNPAHQQLHLGWALPDGEEAETLVYRKWEHPGEMEGEAEGEGEGNEGVEEEPYEGAGGVAPKNEVAPSIKAYEPSGSEAEPWVRVKNGLQPGDKLVAAPGTWTATPAPYVYEYKWLRCTSKCKQIPESELAGVETNEYVLNENDIGDTIEVEVIARNGVKPAGTGRTVLPTETIKAPEEGRSQQAIKLKLKGLDGATLSGLLEPEYEVKLNSTGGPHGIQRQMVLKPGA